MNILEYFENQAVGLRSNIAWGERDLKADEEDLAALTKKINDHKKIIVYQRAELALIEGRIEELKTLKAEVEAQ